MSLFAALRRLYALLPGSSRKQVTPLLVLMLCNAFSEVTGVAGLLPFAAVASDPTLIYSQPSLKFLFDSVGSPDPHLFLVYLGAVFLVLLVGMNLLNMTTYWYSLHFSFQFGYRLSGQLLGSYLSRPYGWFLQKNNADLANLVLAEIDSLSETIVLSSAELLTMAFLSLFLVLGLFWVDPLVAFTTTLLLLLVYGQVYRLVRLHLNDLGERRMSLNAERHRAADDALNAVKEARCFSQAPLLHQAYVSRAERYSRLRVLERLVAELPKYATETLGVATLGLILIYLVFRGQSSQHAIPLVCLYIMATWRLVPALQTIYRNSTRICFHAPVLAVIENELQGSVGLSAWGARPRLPLREKVQLNSVSFTYPGNREPALNQVSLEIPRGAVVALVGRTGSGKSTLADILAGLLPVDAGSVEVDGQLLTRENSLDWFQNVGYVPQEIFLTDSTVACNVALGFAAEEIDQEAVRRAARTARLAPFVEHELAQGYDTNIGERGVSLSGGQRQRVGIARALYSDPEFLIMDEATSALDNLTEREVMEAIQELAGEKTLLLIAHRLTTVQLCQRIYLLENGELIAQGTYQELLQCSPEFGRLAQTELQN